jgi:O-antigen/teichoic acid export membrane protein
VSRSAPSLLRGTLLNFADTAISMASALTVSVVLARALGPREFGLYSLVMTVATFVYVAAGFGIGETVRRYVAELDGTGERALRALVGWRGLRLGLLTSGAATVLLVLGAAPLAAFFRHEELRLYFVLGAASLVPMMAGAVCTSVLRGLQQYQYLVRMNILTSPLWLIASAVVVLSGGGVAGLLLVGVAAEIASLAILGWWSYREVGVPSRRAAMPPSLGARLVRYNLAVAALFVINMVVWQRSELIFLGRFHDSHQVAYYALPFSLTERLTALAPGALVGVVLPGLAQAHGAADLERFTSLFSDSIRWLAVMTLPICLMGIPLAGAVIGLLYGPEYGPAVPVLQVLLAAMAFGVLGQAASSALLGLESQGWLLKTGAAAVVVSIGLDLVLIPRWGALGAALANAATQASWAIAAFAPLWGRVLPAARAAAARAAGAALLISLLLALAAMSRPPLLVLLLAGVAGSGAYLAALDRMRLFSVRVLLGQLRPSTDLAQEVDS